MFSCRDMLGQSWKSVPKTRFLLPARGGKCLGEFGPNFSNSNHKWICVQVWLRSVQWPQRLGVKKTEKTTAVKYKPFGITSRQMTAIRERSRDTLGEFTGVCSCEKRQLETKIISTYYKNKNFLQFLFIVKAAVLKQQISKFYPQIQRTEASDHIYFSQRRVINVKAISCAYLQGDIYCMFL